ncbi:MAG: hypothetical protein NUV80_05340 [Candidatus Berkelbacteria bacterium]|nr:hypothetical protein [Candidatus Berkelbacteria bacterium]MCR4307959.1 hypothetical protein [Candidatus Berkelbacteria bacterium]
MRKVVVSGSTINSGQLVDLLRKAVQGGPVTFENFQYYLEDPNRFAAPEQTSLDRAIRLLGVEKVVTAQQWGEVWGREVVETEAGVLKFNQGVLQSAADTNKAGFTDFRIVYYGGTSLREGHQIFGTDKSVQPCYWKDSTWWLGSENDWATHQPKTGYYLLDYKLRFRNMKWQSQENEIAKLGNGYSRAHETVVTEGAFSFYKVHNGERLLEKEYHWGRSSDSDGYRVRVGFFLADGWDVSGLQPGFSRDYLGVVVARN